MVTASGGAPAAVPPGPGFMKPNSGRSCTKQTAHTGLLTASTTRQRHDFHTGGEGWRERGGDSSRGDTGSHGGGAGRGAGGGKHARRGTVERRRWTGVARCVSRGARVNSAVHALLSPKGNCATERAQRQTASLEMRSLVSGTLRPYVQHGRPSLQMKPSCWIRPTGKVGSPAARHPFDSTQMQVPDCLQRTKILSKLKAE
jgi:hypothetical protein